MKNKRNTNPFFRIFTVVVFLVLISVVVSIGLYYYIFAITEPEGLSLASWPNRFTDNFSAWLSSENGNIKVKDIGLERLDEYGLWLQVIDETGQEVFAYNKPDGYPMNYTSAELMSLSERLYENGNTVFTSSFEGADKTYGYIVGFPYAIGKHMVYYNGDNVSRLSPIFRMGILSMLSAIVLFILVYSFWLTKHLGKITKGIGNISLRTYTPIAAKGVFSGVYVALNDMNTEINESDKVRQKTERIRKEWITNITHDVKTPLSPIKGYAELLAEKPIPESKTVQEYGEIILKNANYTEKLINDLKMTYQLESGVMPYNPQEVHLIRYMKELVIDIVNDPAFSNRNVEFESNTEDVIACLDADLFRRAVQNLIVNALIHNTPETKVSIIVNTGEPNDVSIIIRDDGIGMSDEELSKLWDRYYRGTNTKEKSEGSGLGLAIAKQIITLHGGKISVKSKLNEGTEFAISLPLRP